MENNQERRSPGRPRKQRREPKSNTAEFKSVLLEPYMHRDLKKVSMILDKNMRDLLEEVFYSNPLVISTLEKLKKIDTP